MGIKIKNIFILFLLMALAIFIYGGVLLRVDENNNAVGFMKRCFGYYQVIENGLGLYTQEKIDQLRPDEYLLINEIVNRKKIKNLDLFKLKERYAENVFKRILNKNNYIANIQIEKNKDIVNAIGKPLEGNFYSIRNIQKDNYVYDNFGRWNDILLKAIYCDRTGFDNGDFYILKLLKSQDGGYLDTHYLFGLLFLEKNNCYAQDEINKQIKEVSADIAAAEANDKTFSDLYAERIVFLYWAGYGDLVKKDWVDFVKDNFNAKYGWTEKNSTSFNGHVSGLSLLSLIYFMEGKNAQPFYANNL
jgi:hypothetical protein